MQSILLQFSRILLSSHILVLVTWIKLIAFQEPLSIGDSSPIGPRHLEPIPVSLLPSDDGVSNLNSGGAYPDGLTKVQKKARRHPKRNVITNNTMTTSPRSKTFSPVILNESYADPDSKVGCAILHGELPVDRCHQSPSRDRLARIPDAALSDVTVPSLLNEPPDANVQPSTGASCKYAPAPAPSTANSKPLPPRSHNPNLAPPQNSTQPPPLHLNSAASQNSSQRLAPIYIPTPVNWIQFLLSFGVLAPHVLSTWVVA